MENNTNTPNDNFMQNVMNAFAGIPTTTPTKRENALTKGLGFHKFDGSVSVDEVMQQIGADFNVEKQRLVRLTPEMVEAITLGVPVTIPTECLINTHCATVNTRDNSTLGIVGSDYGVIQNSKGLEILDLLTNAEIAGNNYQIVSAGLVHDSDPYVQVRLPNEIRVNGDNSKTEFYASFYTRHDGKGGLKIAMSAIRVVCQNTFNANFSSKQKMTYRHTKNVEKMLDFDNGDNIQRIQRIVAAFNVFTSDHLATLNHLAEQRITERYINQFCARIFIMDEENRKLAQQYNYNWDLLNANTRTNLTRSINQITEFRNVLENGAGQDTNRGSKLWLYNGLTNTFSNADYKTPEKRFDFLTQGSGYEKSQTALEYLMAEVAA